METKTFDVSVKDGRKVLVMMTGVSWDEAISAVNKAKEKCGKAKKAIVEITEIVAEASA